MRKIKTGDNVIVMRGKDAGKTGEVLKVVKKVNGKRALQTKVVIKGVNIITRHQKPNPTFNIPGGLLKIEKPVDISNVMLVDAKTNKPTRITMQVDAKTGKKSRVYKKSKQAIK
jgi:large subunit ribosomal protein L24